MRTRAREVLIYAAVAVALAVAGLWGLSHVLRTREPRVALARATREALEMPRETRRDAEDALARHAQHRGQHVIADDRAVRP